MLPAPRLPTPTSPKSELKWTLRALAAFDTLTAMSMPSPLNSFSAMTIPVTGTTALEIEMPIVGSDGPRSPSVPLPEIGLPVMTWSFRT